jgi:hypothetical protein
VKRNYYDVPSLERVLAHFEQMYQLSSADFYATIERGDTLHGMPAFHRHSWASFYRDVRRMRGDDFADHAGRVLAGMP